MNSISSLFLVLTIVFLAKNIECFSKPLSSHNGRFKRHSPIQEDNDGRYVLWQENESARCSKCPFKCEEVKYIWPVEIFTFAFKRGKEPTCNRYVNTDDFKGYNLPPLSSIRDEIAEKWGVAVRKNFSVDEQLTDYWDALGVCATEFKGLDTEFKYYKKSLELFDKYSMDVILRESNILPGKNYTYQEISDAVSKRINGKTPMIECGKMFEDIIRDNVLSRIGFFLDQNFNPVDEADAGEFPNSFKFDECPRDGLIYYQNSEDFSNDVKCYGLMYGVTDSHFII